MVVQTDKGFAVIEKCCQAIDKRLESLTRRIDRILLRALGLTVSLGPLIATGLKRWP